jgi:hypothetical protein
MCEGCSVETHLMIVIDEGVRFIKNVPVAVRSRYLIDAPASGSPWLASGTTASPQPCSLHLT